jgi:hypothetical protein
VATDPVREEAERLVAAAMAAVSMAARGLGGRSRGSQWSTGAAGGFATGSAECCVCPVCRVIAAMREPDVDLAERLSSGAGDLAGGVAALLRSFSRRSRDEEDADDAWHTATSAPPTTPMAKKAIAKKAVAKKAVAKKAVAKKAVAAVPGEAATAEAPAEETPPKKAVKKTAKKAVKKAAKKAAPRKAAGEIREGPG